jgi:antitoxin ParD1/3/4
LAANDCWHAPAWSDLAGKEGSLRRLIETYARKQRSSLSKCLTPPSGGRALNVSLTPELEEFVQERVRTGRYTSASEVVREALRLLQDRDELRRLRMDELRVRVAAGLDSLDRG